ncbi:AEL_collapsed_G0032100.mRNA.1.CDS.1 [Saccharomyces cerevisiae]|nr:AEL_collapsed_G0032100.mRNA.1.CDS.1 [Saccharomyces cerevisiae]
MLTFVKYATEVTRFFTYLALGCLFNKDRSPEKTGSKFPGLQYFETALRLQSELLKVYDMMANTSLVQSFLYVAYYALSLDKPEFAYLTIGSAIRMVFTLNYHKKTTTFTENRVFWLCFVYDRLVSVRFGFPLMINELDIDVSLLNEPTISSQETLIDSCHFNWQVKLVNIITQTLRKIYTRNSFLSFTIATPC